MCVDDAAIYEIRVKGVLDDRWSEWFDGMTLSSNVGDETTLTGPVADQAALHGLLAKVRDLGLPLLSVRRQDPQSPGADRAAPHRGPDGDVEPPAVSDTSAE